MTTSTTRRDLPVEIMATGSAAVENDKSGYRHGACLAATTVSFQFNADRLFLEAWAEHELIRLVDRCQPSNLKQAPSDSPSMAWRH